MKNLILVLISLTTIGAHAAKTEIVEVNASTCKKKEFAVDAGPFQIDLFCEDALGAYLGVVYRGRMGAAGNGKWHIGDRYWQNKQWSNDVRSFAILSATKAAVSTSAVYGDAGVFILNLSDKTFEKIYSPKAAKDDTSFVIKGFDGKTGKLQIVEEVSKSKITVDVK